MNLGRRLLRAARHQVQRGLGNLIPGQSVDPAEQELRDYLHRHPPQPSAPPPHPHEAEYRLIGAPVGSDLETVQRCWRRVIREIHPDRYAGDPGAQARAAEQLRRVNEAYARLKAHLEHGR